MKKSALRHQILELVADYVDLAHAPQPFVPGETPVPVAGRVFGQDEVIALVDSALDFWLTTGRFNAEFETKLAQFMGIDHLLTANSGSSANLLAIAALTSPKLEARALVPGDEVITVAAAFPTTVNPIIQHGLIPVFVDIEIPTYNIDPDLIERAVSGKTRAIVLAHTLGNPFDLEQVMRIAKKYNLWVVEDCCDALGSTYQGKLVGTFGDIGTLSFYPAHHLTMGEGGAIFTNSGLLKSIIQSFRDWGRDCFCEPGQDNTCRKRFQRQLGSLPRGYDHKYIYSHLGYNLKITDMQAAVGVAQLGRLSGFIKKRKENFQYLRERMQQLDTYFILPKATPDSEPSWFGFPLTIRENMAFTREELLTYLNQHKIGTRLVFAGNIIRQPYFEGREYKVCGGLPNTDALTVGTFWLGVYPGLSPIMLEYVAEKIEDFVKTRAK